MTAVAAEDRLHGYVVPGRRGEIPSQSLPLRQVSACHAMLLMGLRALDPALGHELRCFTHQHMICDRSRVMSHVRAGVYATCQQSFFLLRFPAVDLPGPLH